MKNTGPQRTPRSWTKTWSLMTLGFAAVVFGALANDWDPAQAYAQEAPKAKTKVGKKAEPKNAPAFPSLTNGKAVDAVALAKIIDQEIAKRIKAEKATSAGLCSDEE